MAEDGEIEAVIYRAIQGTMSMAIKTEAVMAGLRENRDVVLRWLDGEHDGDYPEADPPVARWYFPMEAK